ncbi:MAG: ketopantoate reductase family protein [Treponema sp.]|nr:ketopantoate reductase family protein [Treponema sp.]
MKINSVLIAGAGAIGLPTAETIFKADPGCISILAKGERFERYSKNGFWVNGEKLPLRLTEGEESDLIIVSCKFHHLKQVIEDIRPSVGKDTIILSLLNGISSEEIIGEKLGRERIPLAMIIGTDAHHENGQASYHRKGTIHFGDANGKNGEREEAVAEFFTRTGVEFKLEQNMRRSLWYKYMFNVGGNQTTAILRLPYAALQSKGNPGEIPEARILFEKGMREVITIANAEGIDLNEGDIESINQMLNVFNPDATTSMCQDVLAGRKTELEMFSLTMIELGKKHNIPVPINEIFYLQLKTIEQSQRP